MASREQLRQRLVSGDFASTDQLWRCALDALDFELFEEIAATVGARLEGDSAADHRLWQVLALALRGMQDSAGAHIALLRSDALRPNDPLLVQSLAQTALEGGEPASALFARARALKVDDPTVLTGQASALMAEGRAQEARDGLADLLRANPAWLTGHATYAQITAMTAPGADQLQTYREAIAKHPQAAGLWLAMINTAMNAADYERSLELVSEARAMLGPSDELSRAEASCLSECGRSDYAQTLFEALPQPASASLVIHPLRNLIRMGRFNQAQALAERSFGADEDLALWPYRALLWRLHGDPRWDWLEGDEALIKVYDIGAELGSIPALADMLRDLHRRSGPPIDQSVRGGSQTDGNLLARNEPEIRRLRTAMLDAVADYVANLPAPREGHPTLLARRGPLRVEGAWSVRLTDQGFHADHLHFLGWISSALYIALPEGEGGIGRHGPSQAGWLTFGECLKLLPDFRAFRVVEPKVGQLALFPSTMWHGTRPFAAGERLTVAIDIARPAQ